MDIKNPIEAQIDSDLRSRAIEYVMSHKAAAFKLYLLKVINYFNVASKFRGKLSGVTSSFKDIIMFLTYSPLLIIFLYRIIKYRLGMNRFELLVVALYFGNALCLAVFHTIIRFRLPFDFLLIGVLASFISHAGRQYVRSSDL